jgi:hypothetical protein
MYSVRTLGNGLKQASRRAPQFRRGAATNAAATEDIDVAQARKYCLNQLRSVSFALMPLSETVH